MDFARSTSAAEDREKKVGNGLLLSHFWCP